MAVVNVPDPCPRTPDSMNSVTGGFYCDDCCKVVIDFRDKSNEEILETMSVRSSKRICGIFNKTQASRGPKPTFELARFAAALLLVFGSVLFTSCEDSNTVGKLCDPDYKTDSFAAVRALEADSLRMADTVYVSDTLNMQCDTQYTVGWMEPEIKE